MKQENQQSRFFFLRYNVLLTENIVLQGKLSQSVSQRTFVYIKFVMHLLFLDQELLFVL